MTDKRRDEELQSASRARWEVRKYFRIPLWLFLISVIPLSLVSRSFSEKKIYYSEVRDEVLGHGDVIVSFEKDATGKVLKHPDSIENAYSSLGVSFCFGVPIHLPQYMNKLAKFQPEVLSTSQADGLADTRSNDQRDADVELLSRNKFDGTRGDIVVSVSHFRFPKESMPQGRSEASVKPYLFPPKYLRSKWAQGPFASSILWDRPLTIYFHAPDEQKTIVGVSRVGFFLGDIRTPGYVVVRLFSPEGEYLCQQRNLSAGVLFMGFTAKNLKIGWIEIEHTGNKPRCEIGPVSFGPSLAE